MQGVVSEVRRGGDLVRGDAQQQLLVVPPGEQQAARRQTEDAVLLRPRLQGQHLQLLQPPHPQNSMVISAATSQLSCMPG